MYIDAKNTNRLARYVNHSCKPNAVLTKVWVAAKSPSDELWIVATTYIERDSEITINYGRGYTEFFQSGTCACNECQKS